MESQLQMKRGERLNSTSWINRYKYMLLYWDTTVKNLLFVYWQKFWKIRFGWWLYSIYFWNFWKNLSLINLRTYLKITIGKKSRYIYMYIYVFMNVWWNVCGIFFSEGPDHTTCCEWQCTAWNQPDEDPGSSQSDHNAPRCLSVVEWRRSLWRQCSGCNPER